MVSTHRQTRLLWLNLFKARWECLDSVWLFNRYIEYLENKWPDFRDKSHTIPYSEISAVDHKTSWIGSLFGYGTVIIYAEDKTYKLEYMSKSKELYRAIQQRL